MVHVPEADGPAWPRPLNAMPALKESSVAFLEISGALVKPRIVYLPPFRGQVPSVIRALRDHPQKCL